MTIKSKLALFATVILAVGVWIWWPDHVEPPTAPPKTNIEASVAPAQADLDKQATASADANSIEREAVTTPAIATSDPTTGSVVVHLRYGDDKTPVPGMMMALRKLGEDSRYSSLRSRTDDTGSARYDDVAPGHMYVCPVNARGKRVEVVAGETAEIDIEIEVGMNLSGIVIDPDHRPVAGALIETTMMAHADAFPEIMTVSGADGRFTIRACHTLCLVGARAEGYVASNVRFLHGKKGNHAEVELMLGPKGAVVDGIVVDEDGRAVPNAIIIIGKGELSGIPGRDHIPPFAALTRTDENGKFHAIGVEAGTQPVMARAKGFAPYESECEVATDASTSLKLTLAKGADIHGVVHDETGKVVGRTEIKVGTWSDFRFFRTRTASDGSYQLSGLPAGEIKVEADHDDFGKAQQVTTTTAGETATVDLTLSRGFQLRGRVVDPDGNPVANVYCDCMPENAINNGWFKFVKTNAQGEFVADNCPETGTISIRVVAKAFEELRVTGIDPHAGEVRIQLKHRAASTVRVVGTVIAPDGTPSKNTSVYGIREGGSSESIEATDDNGHFELGPYPPGTWTVYVRSREYPTFLSSPRVLAANETLDLGTITLQQGGTAVVRRLDDGEAKARFIGTGIGLKRSIGFSTVGDTKRSSATVPGDYLLLTSGKGIACTATPYTVRAGEETVIDVHVKKGTQQLLKVTRADGAKVKPFSVYVRRGKELVARVWARAKPDGSAVGETWLLPGDYTLTGTKGDLTGATTFSVGAAAGPTASITLR